LGVSAWLSSSACSLSLLAFTALFSPFEFKANGRSRGGAKINQQWSREALLNASGYVTPRRRATIAAKITGRVIGVFFDEGTHVSEGQLLATLDDSDARKALDSAKADYAASKAAIADLEVQLKNARIQLRRAEQLQNAGPCKPRSSSIMPQPLPTVSRPKSP